MTIGIQGLVIALALLLPSGSLAQTEYDLGRPAYAQLAQASPSASSNNSIPEKPVNIAAQIEAQREAPPAAVPGEDPRDPTANVLQLQRAGSQRQDDLRENSERFILQALQNNEKMDELRFEMSNELRAAETRRVDALAAAEAKRLDQLAEAEAKRIDAIRTVDVNAVGVQNQRAVEQATVLSTNVTQSADTLRNLVANTATTVASAQEASNQALSTKIDQAFTGLQARVAALEQAQYVGQGKQTLSDPALQALVEQVKVLAAAQSQSTGVSAGSDKTVNYIFGGIGMLGVLAGILFAVLNRPKPPAPVPNGNGPPNYYNKQTEAA